MYKLKLTGVELGPMGHDASLQAVVQQDKGVQTEIASPSMWQDCAGDAETSHPSRGRSPVLSTGLSVSADDEYDPWRTELQQFSSSPPDTLWPESGVGLEFSISVRSATQLHCNIVVLDRPNPDQPADDLETGELLEMQCSSGNPLVEMTVGKIFLYRCAEPTGSIGLQPPPMRSNLLCVLAVPTYLAGAGLLQWVAGYAPALTHVRVVRAAVAHQYMVLLKFISAAVAESFRQDFHGKRFSSLEPETAIVLHVAQVELEGEESDRSGDVDGQGGDTEEMALLATCTQLPNCAVCLDRLDPTVTGIITTVCNHSFHCRCLAKWGEARCPVCRHAEEEDRPPHCFVCDSTDNLWMCLICGFVGCGRYAQTHSYGHYKETNHTFSMELDTQRVWDYTGDNYVHRLIQNKVDGSFVELPDPRLQRSEVQDADLMQQQLELQQRNLEDKFDVVVGEYSMLLADQLETQRLYFEGLLEEQEQHTTLALCEAQEKALEEEVAVQDLVTRTERDLKLTQKRLQSQGEKLKKTQQEADFHAQLNQQLFENQKALQDQLTAAKERETALEEQVRSMEEQMRDLFIHLEAQNTIHSEASGSELANGAIFCSPSNSEGMASPSNGRKRSSKNRKR